MQTVVVHLKQTNLNDQLEQTVSEIDHEVRLHDWFDFHVLKYDGYRLLIGGGVDLTYSHELEIIFEDVFFATIFFDEWHSDTRKTVIELPSEKQNKELNLKFEIQQGFQIFIIHPEDFKNKIYIAAKNLNYKKETVYYYDRQELKDNERIADFVKKEK